MKPHQCPCKDPRTVTILVGTHKTVFNCCEECAASILPKKFPQAVTNGLPFIIRIQTARGILELNGKWIGVPTYLTSKQIGGLLAVWDTDQE
jgi:hypothetical protein